MVTFADMDKEPGNSKRQRYSTSTVHHSSNSRKVASEASSGESGIFLLYCCHLCMYIALYVIDVIFYFNMEHLKKKKYSRVKFFLRRFQ